MTHQKELSKKISELNELFLTLNDTGQETVLNILRSLKFAQSLITLPESTSTLLTTEESKNKNKEKKS